MEKVLVIKVLKGKDSTKSIGMLDTKAKLLFVPFVSKKDMPVIDVVHYDYITKTEGGYCIEEVVVVDDRHYVNTYYVKSLKEDK